MKGHNEMFFRITALWAVTESVLGGILHGLKVPITGILVGGLAVVYIAMLARLVSPRAIWKATLLVMVIKGVLAPHSPFGAYFAVGFQGGMGYLLFRFMPHFQTAALVLGMINLLESALQKLIVTTLIFGMDVWVAVEEFIAFVMGQMGYSGEGYLKSLLFIYLGIYALAGLFFGFLGGVVPKKLLQFPSKYPELHLVPPADWADVELPKRKKRIKPGKWLIFGLWLFLLLLFLAQSLFPDLELLPKTRIAQLLIRAFLFIIGWLFIIGPWLTQQLKAWLGRKQMQWASDLEQVMGLLPLTKWLFSAAWQASKVQAGPGRIWLFGKIILVNFMQVK